MSDTHKVICHFKSKNRSSTKPCIYNFDYTYVNTPTCRPTNCICYLRCKPMKEKHRQKGRPNLWTWFLSPFSIFLRPLAHEGGCCFQMAVLVFKQRRPLTPLSYGCSPWQRVVGMVRDEREDELKKNEDEAEVEGDEG